MTGHSQSSSQHTPWVSPCCKTPLVHSEDDSCSCSACRRVFPIVSGVPWLRLDRSQPGPGELEYQQGWRGKLRRWPKLYRWIFLLFAPVLITGPNPVHRWRQLFAAKKRVVDIGSGNDRRHPDILNLDLLPYPAVDVVALAEELPLPTQSVHGAISVVALEHMRSPQTALAEMARVLVPGGRLFVAIPLLQPFHSAPADYRRWTVPGLEAELGEWFRVVDQGCYCGPCSALAWLLADVLALVLSLGWAPLRRWGSILLQVAFSPLKWFDLLVARLPGASGVASVVYVEAERLSSEGSVGAAAEDLLAAGP